ncbi:MAG: ABC transporter permease [bacterium]|nr:ABC transporter permease [bacterium]
MTLLAYARLALDGMGANKLRSGLTMLGVIIGVAAVVSLVSIGQGAREEATGRLGDMSPDHLMVTGGGMGPAPRGSRPPARLTPADTAAISRLEGVLAACSVADSSGELAAGDLRVTGTVVATEPAAEAAFRLSLADGCFLAAGDRRGIVLGARLSVSLFPGGSAVGQEVLLADTAFTVRGVLAPQPSVLMYNFDRRSYISLEAADELGLRTELGHIAVRAESTAKVAALADEIESLLKERHSGAGVGVLHQQAMIDAIDSVLTILTGVLTGIASISLIVGGIGIMNIMLATVTERTHEIGIRKAVGARDRDVLLQFLVEAAVLSVVGGLIGIAVGIGGARLAARLIRHLPVATSWWGIGLAFGFSLAVGLFFGVWPARRAARMEPVAALRHD